MKTLAITALLLPTFFLGCFGEFTTSQESDLVKYPELNVFVHEMIQFQGDVTDLESGTFRFSYSSREPDPRRILQAIDAKARAEDWRLLFQKYFIRCYTKNLHRYPAQTRDDVVIVEYDAGKESIRIEWQSK